MSIRESVINELVHELVEKSFSIEKIERAEVITKVLRRLPDNNLFSLYFDTFGKVIGQDNRPEAL